LIPRPFDCLSKVNNGISPHDDVEKINNKTCFAGFFIINGAVFPELDIVNPLKQLLCINRELISLSLLDWSEVDLLLRRCILSGLLFPFIFIVYTLCTTL